MKHTFLITLGATLALTLVAVGQEEGAAKGPFGGGRREGERQPQGRAARQEMRQQQGREQGRFLRGGNSSEMLFRILQNPESIAEIGLNAEKTAALKDAFGKIQVRQIDLEAERSKLNLQQNDLVASLLADRKKDAEAALQQVEAIGKVNTALDKLTIDRLLAIREHLSDAEITKARAIANQRMEQMRARMREGGRRVQQEGGRGNQGGGGQR